MNALNWFSKTCLRKIELVFYSKLKHNLRTHASTSIKLNTSSSKITFGIKIIFQSHYPARNLNKVIEFNLSFFKHFTHLLGNQLFLVKCFL